jgi:hypothetical protein
MPFCSHCNRNVCRKTELLHRKHVVRPRLTTDAVAAFRKSAKSSRITRKHTRQVSPSNFEPDVLMDEELSTPQPDHDPAMDTSAATCEFDESRDAIFRAAMSSAQTHLWPEGTRPYAARVDDHESDGEDVAENDEDGGDGVHAWSFDDDETVDVTDYATELSAWDELGVEFEREASENGKLVSKFFDHANADRLVGRSKYQSFRHGHFACVCAESRVAHDR